MNLKQLMAQLEDQALVIRNLVAVVGQEQARWKPDENSWSVLETINHLYDEEYEDFRANLDCVLHGKEWNAIGPGRETERGYNQREVGQSLTNFMVERGNSLAWLKSQPEPDWEKAYVAHWGAMRAGDMAAAWLAHDLLHIRQLVELHWAWLNQEVAPFETRYAGEW